MMDSTTSASSTPDTVIVGSTIHQGKLDEYDLNMRPVGTTGAAQVDAELNFIMSQVHKIREACGAGFNKLDQITAELNTFGAKLDNEIQTMKSQISSEVACDKMGGSSNTIGYKMTSVMDQVEIANANMENKMTMYQANLDHRQRHSKISLGR